MVFWIVVGVLVFGVLVALSFLRPDPFQHRDRPTREQEPRHNAMRKTGGGYGW
jgi:hypothetical protein